MLDQRRRLGRPGPLADSSVSTTRRGVTACRADSSRSPHSACYR
ncbi:hypothetical protein STVIR_8607 [Streptomyces viridochromogenes Tue57]|uniref:Uncharacterized protein n=1 Tax=Streptomyces viridochromogenes Tue57 TaxID=1160705 RepID=L8P2N5_STRVR|nr:hypothetical protein STVIR_8607 [Streptomyces viridochromogenes Tue57]